MNQIINKIFNSIKKILTARFFEGLMAVLLIVAMFILSKQSAVLVTNMNEQKLKSAPRIYTVVLDAGHGGIDSGKVGVGGILEKDINLKIMRRLKAFLNNAGVNVVLTRDTDGGLYNENDSNKKIQDMKRRLEIMASANADIVVSIHQNSYTEASVRGAEVYYYHQSKPGKQLAEILQRSLIERADPNNKRRIKANDSYYLLKKSALPIVIVECGYLSNPEEAAALATEEYQSRVAWALHMGILEYLNKNGDRG